MNKAVFEKKVDNLLSEIKEYIENQYLSDNEVCTLRSEIDKLLYECLYYKSKLIS